MYRARAHQECYSLELLTATQRRRRAKMEPWQCAIIIVAFGCNTNWRTLSLHLTHECQLIQLIVFVYMRQRGNVLQYTAHRTNKSQWEILSSVVRRTHSRKCVTECITALYQRHRYYFVCVYVCKAIGSLEIKSRSRSRYIINRNKDLLVCV